MLRKLGPSWISLAGATQGTYLFPWGSFLFLSLQILCFESLLYIFSGTLFLLQLIFIIICFSPHWGKSCLSLLLHRPLALQLLSPTVACNLQGTFWHQHSFPNSVKETSPQTFLLKQKLEGVHRECLTFLCIKSKLTPLQTLFVAQQQGSPPVQDPLGDCSAGASQPILNPLSETTHRKSKKVFLF